MDAEETQTEKERQLKEYEEYKKTHPETTTSVAEKEFGVKAEAETAPQPQAEAPKQSMTSVGFFNDTDARIGLEELEPTDIPTPTLMIIQPNSEATDGEGNLIPRGSFYFRGNRQVYKEVSCSFLALTKKELPDYSDKSLLVHTYIFLGVMESDMSPFLLYLKRTNIGPAKNFLGSVVSSKLPMFAHKVLLTSEKIEGDKGTYYKIKIADQGVHDDVEALNHLKTLAVNFGPKVKVEVTEEAPENTEEVNEEDIPF